MTPVSIQTPIAVLLGGRSAEREISLLSGAAVLRSLQRQGLEAYAVDPIEPDWVNQLKRAKLAFVVLHGSGGEDGAVQGLLLSLGIPFTGSPLTACAVAMDKHLSKTLWRAAGLPTADWLLVNADTSEATLAPLAWPLFVKPTSQGSSLGVHRVEHFGQFAAAYADAASFGGAVMAEAAVLGAELTVGIVADTVLPSIRIEPGPGHVFYDYQAKYFVDDTLYHCPSGLALAAEQALGRLAWQAFEHLGARGWGRVDFLQDARSGQCYLVEANLVPGMTDHSLVPKAAAQLGIGFDALVAMIAAAT